MQLLIHPDGSLKCVYGEAIDLYALGHVRRQPSRVHFSEYPLLVLSSMSFAACAIAAAESEHPKLRKVRTERVETRCVLR